MKGMKRTGSEQIRKVDDAHDQVHWHVSRRGDILRDMVRQVYAGQRTAEGGHEAVAGAASATGDFLKLTFVAKTKCF